jgi:hypothetical protein
MDRVEGQDNPVSERAGLRPGLFVRRAPARHAPVAALLRAAVRTGFGAPTEEVLALAPHLDREGVAAAMFHRVAPALHVLLRGAPGVATAVGDQLAAAHAEQLVRHTTALVELSRVDAAFEGIPFAVLKGPHLAERVWPRPDLRASYDLDVLVDRSRAPEVLERLLAAGCTVPQHDWARLLREGFAQLTVMLPSGLACDVHWELLATAAERRAFAFDAAAVLRRVRRVPLGPITAPVMDPLDTALHVVTHAALAGAGRLVWVLDTAYAVRQADRERLVERAHRTGAALPLAVVLHRAASVGALAADEPLLDVAGDPAWRRLAAAVDGRRPVEAAFGQRATGRLVLAATRSTSRQSSVALARAAVGAVRWVGRTPPGGPDLHARPRPADLAAARAFVRGAAGG